MMLQSLTHRLHRFANSPLDFYWSVVLNLSMTISALSISAHLMIVFFFSFTNMNKCNIDRIGQYDLRGVLICELFLDHVFAYHGGIFTYLFIYFTFIYSFVFILLFKKYIACKALRSPFSFIKKIKTKLFRDPISGECQVKSVIIILPIVVQP